jgi:hypothetical protein
MIQQAGYPGVAADFDQDVVNALMPALEKRARDMDAQPLPAEPTPNLVPRLWEPSSNGAESCALLLLAPWWRVRSEIS